MATCGHPQTMLVLWPLAGACLASQSFAFLAPFVVSATMFLLMAGKVSAARNTRERPHITKITLSASETCFSKLSKVAMRCFLTDFRCTQAQSHKEAIKGHHRWGTCLIPLLSAHPSIIQFPLPQSRRGDNKVCLIPMVTRSPTPGHCWAVDLRRWRHLQDSCEHPSSIWAEMSTLVLVFWGLNLDGRAEYVNTHSGVEKRLPPSRFLIFVHVFHT